MDMFPTQLIKNYAVQNAIAVRFDLNRFVIGNLELGVHLIPHEHDPNYSLVVQYRVGGSPALNSVLLRQNANEADRTQLSLAVWEAVRLLMPTLDLYELNRELANPFPR